MPSSRYPSFPYRSRPISGARGLMLPSTIGIADPLFAHHQIPPLELHSLGSMRKSRLQPASQTVPLRFHTDRRWILVAPEKSFPIRTGLEIPICLSVLGPRSAPTLPGRISSNALSDEFLLLRWRKAENPIDRDRARFLSAHRPRHTPQLHGVFPGALMGPRRQIRLLTDFPSV